MSRFLGFISPLALLLTIALVAGCGSDGRGGAALPAMETHADSVAMQLYAAHGGPEAWPSAPYLRFDFGIEREGSTQVVAKHLWNRQTGAYRVEWSASPDSEYVALLDVDAFGEHASQSAPGGGQVYLNGAAVDSAANASLMERAHQRFVNDSYWLLAPLKVFDPGVSRSYVADSSDAQHDVIRLTFGEVGLTPGDQYWLYVSKESGQLDGWAFHLQGMEEDAPARRSNWTDYQSFETPGGTVLLSARKEAVGGGAAIVFPTLELPASVPDDAFSNPDPQL